jgi:AraC-like DNA-binding protein
LPAVLETWHRFDIRRIDDLSNAVLGADLEATQMAGARVRGSLAFAARDGIIFSSGLISGNVAIRGPLSKNAVTLSIFLKLGPGSRFWLNEMAEGDVAVILPGDDCDTIYAARSLYLAATLTTERLEKEAENDGLVWDRGLVSRTALRSTPIEPRELEWLRRQTFSIHRSGVRNIRMAIGRRLLRDILSNYTRLAQTGGDVRFPVGPAKIVHDARDYIRRNPAKPISVDDLVKATGTSPRSLFRAFSEVLADTPHSYVRRLQLHRIRRELTSGCRTNTISSAAHKWGVGQDLGRLSRSYRELFGENPTCTLAHGHALQHDDTWL